MHWFGQRKETKLIPLIKTYLLENGLKPISVNVKNINLYFKQEDTVTYLVALFAMEKGDEFSKDQFLSIQNQLVTKVSKGYQTNGNVMDTEANKDKEHKIDREHETNHNKVEVLNLIATNHIEKVKAFISTESRIWVIDLKESRIIQYENQSSDFLGLYHGIDQILNSHLSKNQAMEPNGNYYNNVNRIIKKDRVWPFSPCNTTIVIINIIIFLAMDIFRYQETFFNKGDLYWPAVINNKEYYRLLTSMFIHMDISHLLNNMLILLFIGDNLEKTVGKFKYLVIYFMSGIIAGIVSMRYNMEIGEIVGSVGASGAIFGVIGAVAYTVLIYRGRIKDFSPRRMLFFIFLSLYGGFTNQGIDNAAHIGGLISGVILAAILHLMNKKRSTA